MTTFPPVADQLAVIRRGVEKVVPEEELASKLEHSRNTGRPLRVKYGIDPTGIDVHLGHTVPLRKMRQFQELGHQAVIIIGNATAMVGDPSGRDKARSQQFTADEVEANARDYLQQVGKVIDLTQAEVHRNGDWFLSMAFGELLRLCGQVTVAQLLTRDDFAKRYSTQTPIFLHECLYPVMQAFDSVVIGADIELGGTEQLYSFMLARDLQREPAACALAERRMPQPVKERRLKDGSLPQQLGVMSPILVGLDGVRRMGKSLGNYIGISEPPYEMMKKFMQVPDAVMRMYYELLTDVAVDEVESLLKGHPKDAKLRLGRTVIAQYHSDAEGSAAADRWQREIGGGELPSDIPTVTIPASAMKDGTIPAAVLLKTAGLVPSTSEARRLINGGGAYFGEDLQPIQSFDQPIAITAGLLLKVGKKKVVRLTPSNVTTVDGETENPPFVGDSITELPVISVVVNGSRGALMGASSLLKSAKLVASVDEARQLIEGVGVYVGDDFHKIMAHDDSIKITDDMLVRIGDGKTVRLKVTWRHL